MRVTIPKDLKDLETFLLNLMDFLAPLLFYAEKGLSAEREEEGEERPLAFAKVPEIYEQGLLIDAKDAAETIARGREFTAVVYDEVSERFTLLNHHEFREEAHPLMRLLALAIYIDGELRFYISEREIRMGDVLEALKS